MSRWNVFLNITFRRVQPAGKVNNILFVPCYATLHPALSVRPSVRPSVRSSVRPSHFTFFVFFCGLWPHCSCPSDQVTSNTAPAHPHATGVAVYPALFTLKHDIQRTCPSVHPLHSISLCQPLLLYTFIH